MRSPLDVSLVPRTGGMTLLTIASAIMAELPSGDGWLHEIKHDGFRVIAQKDGLRVRLYSRPGNDLTRRFPLIVDALSRLRSRYCIIDGEAVACDDNGVASLATTAVKPPRKAPLGAGLELRGRELAYPAPSVD